MVDGTNKLYTVAHWLAQATIVYNIVEGILATVLGFEDETLALFGFGLDSFIETVSGVGVLYMITRIKKYGEQKGEKSPEIRALKITGYAFYSLVGLLITGSLVNIIIEHKPETTFWGVVISSISIIVMIGLVYGKLFVGKRLRSAAIIADAQCTKVCVYMSLILLVSSAIYELTRFSYLDSLGTLGLAWVSLREGRECFSHLREGRCSHGC